MKAGAMRVRGVGVSLAVLSVGFGCGSAHAVGVSPYLPLNIEPEIERQIERVLILGDEPILRRPIAAATVMQALPKACERDAELCERVRSYLQRYMGDSGITEASVTAAASHGADPVLSNQHGLTARDSWEVSAEGYVQPSDYLLANVGGIAYPHRTVPTGSVLSLGWDAAQLDLGWLDHWMSPLTDSSMLPGTEAPTMPGVTISNFRPLTRLGIEYELFLVRMSESSRILYNDVLSSGYPKLAGFHLSIEPVTGWSFGVNRVLQYGGGAGLPSSAHFLIDDFFKPSGTNQTRGNQQASYVSRFVFPGRTPFAVYAEYAGEDNSDGGSYLLGNAALSMGVDFPRLWGHFDATLETSEWQNIWYVHNVYLDGMTDDHLVLGNWGADQRVFGDGVGARSLMARIGWEFPDGGYLQERVRTLANEPYYGDQREYSGIPPVPYHHYYDLSVTYSRPLGSLTVGGDLLFGRDVFGQHFSRLDGFVRFAPSGHHGYADFDTDEHSDAAPLIEGAEVFVEAGPNVSSVRTNVEPNLPTTVSTWKPGPHVAIGARRAVSESNDLGARLELDKVADHSLIGIRMLDYRHRFGKTFAVSAFVGAADYEQATPAESVYAGVGAQLRNLVPGWDVGADFRYYQNLARDHVLPTDVQGPRPETFYKISSVALSISRHF
jgi:hypothetical protein